MGVLLVNFLVLPMTEPHSNQPQTKQNFGSFFFFFFFFLQIYKWRGSLLAWKLTSPDACFRRGWIQGQRRMA